MNSIVASNPRSAVVVRIDPSVQYHPPEHNELQVLQAASHASLDMVALIGAGSLTGYEALQRDYDRLLLLEKAGILSEADSHRLQQHRNLRTRTTILPGFMTQSSDGVWLSAIFDTQINLNNIEAVIHHIGIDTLSHQARLDAASICALVHAASGLAIAHPHATPPHLHPLILTLINNNILHAIDRDMGESTPAVCVLGGSGAQTIEQIGAAFTEVHTNEISFAALRDTIMQHTLDATKFVDTPIRRWAIDQLIQAGNTNNIIHSADVKINELVPHLAALANAEGGILLLGVENSVVVGIKNKDKTMVTLQKAAEQIDPAVQIAHEEINMETHTIIRVEVRSDHPPHLSNDGRVYVRRENQTVPASAQELRDLFARANAHHADLDLPRSGVSIVSSQRRSGVWYYEVRDLRTTAGVTRDRAQGLWQDAIDKHESIRNGSADLNKIKWMGAIGYWNRHELGGRPKYDLVHRNSQGDIDYVFYGVSDWGLSAQWQQLIDTFDPQASTPHQHHQDEESVSQAASPSTGIPAATNMALTPAYQTIQGEVRRRWRGRGAIWRIWRDEQSKPRFDLFLRNKVDKEGSESFEIQEYQGVTRDQLNQAWLDLIQVKKPRTGIEVVEVITDDQGEMRFVFRNLRNDEVSPHPWRMNDIEDGSIRQYAARMHLADQQLDEEHIRWWGNIGYMRPMRRQVDLIYRDEEGVDHIFYAARRDELTGEWNDLLAEYEDSAE